MISEETSFSSSQIGAALGKHPEMSQYDIERVGTVWVFSE